MSLDPQIATLLESLWGLPRLDVLEPAAAREVTNAMARSAPPGPALQLVENRQITLPTASLGVRIYRAVERPRGLIVYYHAGGWVLGSLDSPDAALREFALRTQCNIVSVDYRLAPEHPFPAAVIDAEQALVWAAASIAELAAPGVPLLVAGESAGANLATVISLLARKRREIAIAGQLLFYPVTDCDFERPSYRECAEGYFLTRDLMRWFWNHYAPSPAQRQDFRAAPLRAPDLSGLPPALIQTAEYDPLRDEGEAYGERLIASGVRAEAQRRAGLIHGFVGMTAMVQAARRAVDDAVAWVDTLL